MRIILLLAAVAAAPTPDKIAEFDSMNEAAVKVLQVASNWTPAYERGGVIVRLPDGKYGVSYPETNFSGDHVAIDEDPEEYNGVIVATYHTHPCLPASHFPSMFSPEDLKIARSHNQPIYMADLCTGLVHRWQPGERYESPTLGAQLAKGTIVGKIVVSGTVQEPLPPADKT